MSKKIAEDAGLAAKMKALREQMAELERQRKETAGRLFAAEAKSVFEQHPGLESFGWRQYTPYFADGDVPEFSAHTDYLDVRFAGGDYEEQDGRCWDEKTKNVVDGKTPKDKAVRSALAFLKQFDQSDFESMFGDHCRVTVTPAGADVEEYEHD